MYYWEAFILRQDDFIKGQLVLLGWRHGKQYGGHMPACMVMSCIANRVKCGQGSWLEILDRVPIYSAINVQPTGLPSIWEPIFVRLLHEVEGIFDGSGKDVSCGALYWADLRNIETDWFRENILKKPDQHPRTADSNSLVFFR